MDVLVSLCNELLLGFKLVRIARGLEHGLALQAISPGLVGGALGEDHMFMLGPLRQAASELVIRQPFDAAEAALVVRAANRSPAAVLFLKKTFMRFRACGAASVRSAIAHGRQDRLGGSGRDATM